MPPMRWATVTQVARAAHAATALAGCRAGHLLRPRPPCCFSFVTYVAMFHARHRPAPADADDVGRFSKSVKGLCPFLHEDLARSANVLQGRERLELDTHAPAAVQPSMAWRSQRAESARGVPLRRTKMRALPTRHSLMLSLLFIGLVMPLRLPQNLFGQPSHLTRRPSATSFWGLDVSCGAGSISSPVLMEHPKRASAVWSEKAVTTFARALRLGRCSRPSGSRRAGIAQGQDGILPELLISDEAQPKARRLAKEMRQNLDDRIQRMLQPAGYGNAERLVTRFVTAEVDELKGTINSLDDVVRHEVTQAVLEVAEAEIAERIQSTVGAIVQLNKTAAEQDLDEIMRRADLDGDRRVTLDELYELIAGQPSSHRPTGRARAPRARPRRPPLPRDGHVQVGSVARFSSRLPFVRCRASRPSCGGRRGTWSTR